MTQGDPLYRDRPIAWAEDYPVLGMSVAIEATDANVAPIVAPLFDAWRTLPRHLRSDTRVTIRIVVHDDGQLDGDGIRVAARMPDPQRLFLLTTGSMACADAVRSEAVVYVTRDLLGDHQRFGREFVEALVLFLVAHLDRQPFHCAALVREGTTVLLTGPPGVGKSTLAYAGLMHGWKVLAEDVVWIQQHRTFRIWGWAPTIRLPSEARRHFPTVNDAPEVRHNDERKLLVTVPATGRVQPPIVDRAMVCLLERHHKATPRMEPVDRETVAKQLLASIQPGFDVFPTTIPALVASLGEHAAWRLKLGPDPNDAIVCLDALARGTDIGAAR